MIHSEQKKLLKWMPNSILNRPLEPNKGICFLNKIEKVLANETVN